MQQMTQTMRELSQQNHSTAEQVLRLQHNYNEMTRTVAHLIPRPQAHLIQHPATPPQHGNPDPGLNRSYQTPSQSTQGFHELSHTSRTNEAQGNVSPEASSRVTSPTIQADRQMKINKAFKQQLASRATVFDGSDCTKYKPWKDAIFREVEGMQLSHAQWLDLLRARTSGGALRALHPSSII